MDMYLYVLVTEKDGVPQFVYGGGKQPHIRSYTSEARAKVYAKKFDAAVIKVNLVDGEPVA